ncbi:MAG: glycosyltransferase family 2 protein [Actinobacteria bacterium]|nr:glycosyltransferase family 2 protein [Actinomycetota bacterium]
MNQVAAIVINRNAAGYLRDCLESLQAQEYAGGISLWVVDNGSDDGSPGMVLSEFPGVNLVWNTGNVGYARACNQGIEVTCEPYMIVLNSDTVLAEDTVRQVAEYLERKPRAGVVAPRLRNSNGTLQYSCRDFPSIKDAFVHAFLGLFVSGNRSSDRYKKTLWDHEGETDVDWVSGAFMAIRREAARAVGGFDEGYFMYVEDVDICWRMWQAGWTVGYIPRGDVFHHIGMSSRMASGRMLFHHHRSMLRFHRKSYKGPCRRLVYAVVAAGVATRFLLITVLNAFYRVRAALGGARRLIMPGRQ